MDTLIKQLIAYLKEHDGWHSKHALTAMKWVNQKDGTTYGADTVGRKLREAEANSLIAVQHTEKNHSEYRFIPEKFREKYIPIADRSDKMWTNQKDEPVLVRYAISYKTDSGRSVKIALGNDERDRLLEMLPGAMLV